MLSVFLWVMMGVEVVVRVLVVVVVVVECKYVEMSPRACSHHHSIFPWLPKHNLLHRRPAFASIIASTSETPFYYGRCVKND